MASVGINRETGEILTGWQHTVQSIITIVTTEVGERVQRRDFGSKVNGLIDKPQNDEEILEFYMAIAEGLEPRRVRQSIYGEPRFKLTQLSFDATVPGVVRFSLGGAYYPDAYRGDFTESQKVELVVPVPLNG